MRLPTAPTPSSGNSHLAGKQIRPRDDEPGADSTIVELPKVSTALILIITFLILAGLLTILVTTYCVLSRRYAARAAGTSSSASPSSTQGDFITENKPPGRTKGGQNRNQAEGRKEGRRAQEGKKKGRKPSTVMLYQHEPEVHGHFAPLYFAGEGPRTGEYLEDVKTIASTLFESGMLGRAKDVEKGEKQSATAGG